MLKKKFSGAINQFLATIIANLSILSYTIGVGWSSPNIPTLKSSETPLDRPLNDQEISWIASILNVGGLFGTLFFGWIADRVGRRRSFIILALPQLVCWLLIAYGTNFYVLLFGRFLCGWCGGGAFVLVPLYVTEISEIGRRGLLGSILMMIYNLGVLIGFVTGSYFSYTFTPNFALGISIVFLIGFMFLPETPQFLLTKDNYIEARQSLVFFRKGYFEEVVEKEIEMLVNSINDQKKSSNHIELKDFTSKSAVKAFIIAMFVVSMTQFCGVLTLLTYTSTIFAEAKTSISPFLASIIVAAVQVIGATMAAYYVDKLGRRLLYMVSSVGTGICLTVLGVYFYLNSQQFDLSDFRIVPLIGVCGVMVFAAWGITTLFCLLVGEMCSQKTRSTISSIAIAWSWVLAFLLLKFFLVITATIGLHGALFIFAACCFGAIVFVAMFMPETKGKSIEEIVALLDK